MGVIQIERLEANFLVEFRAVDAGREVGDLQVVEGFAVFTQRFAFTWCIRR